MLGTWPPHLRGLVRAQKMLRLPRCNVGPRNSAVSLLMRSGRQGIAPVVSVRMAADEWGNVSFGELDSLEVNARRQLAERRAGETSSSALGSQHSQTPPRSYTSLHQFNSPTKIAASPSASFSTSPNGQRKVPVKVYQDIPGRITVETQYNQVMLRRIGSRTRNERMLLEASS